MKKRPDGRIEMKITIGHKIDGKPIRKAFYGATEKECKAKIKAFWQSEFKPVDKDITLKEWGEKWLETYKEGKVRYNTYVTTYKNAAYKHIFPYFKKAKIASIKAIDVQMFYNSKQHLSASSLNKIRITLNGIFESAVENDLIPKNPAFKLRPKSEKKKQEKRSYTKEEVAQVIEFAKTHPNGLAIIVLLKTGLRRGELLALKWANIDMKNRIIQITHAVSVVDGGTKLLDPKTEASKDPIPFDTELRDILQPLQGIGYVINNNGKRVSPTNFYDYIYNPFMADYKKAFPSARTLNAHELRHTYTTLLYESTHDIYLASRCTRHGNIGTTTKVYMHEDVALLRDAIDKTLTTK